MILANGGASPTSGGIISPTDSASSTTTVSRPVGPFDDGGSNGGGGGFGLPGSTFVPIGGIFTPSTGSDTPADSSGGKKDQSSNDGNVTVVVNTGSGTSTKPDSAVSGLGDAIQALAGLFGSFGTTAPQPQQLGTVAVPVQNASDSGSTSGSSSKGGILVFVVIAAVLGLGWFGYKRGWFRKAAKAVASEAK